MMSSALSARVAPGIGRKPVRLNHIHINTPFFFYRESFLFFYREKSGGGIVEAPALQNESGEEGVRDDTQRL